MKHGPGKHNLIVILGPTASGKTRFAVRLAQCVGGEIISADSRQVYRGMDLGTGKDRSEYSPGGTPVPYHLIDILDPQEEFSVFAFQKLFKRTFREIQERGHVPLLVGGTGLYLDAVLRDYALPEVPVNEVLRGSLANEEMESLRRRLSLCCPQLHNRTDLLDRERLLRAIEISEFRKANPGKMARSNTLHPLVLGIRCERAELHQRIADRLKSRMDAGMIEEVHRLHEEGIDWKRMDSFGLEYRYIGLHLQRVLTKEEMVRILGARIKQFAKRQETWFRRMEKNGIHIHWIDAREDVQRVMTLTGYEK